jgi:ribonuclease HI
MTPQKILEAIAALPEDERAGLFARLREIYAEAVPTPVVAKPQRLPLNDWAGQVDYMIVFDGGSRGNPGLGYGSYVIFDQVGSGSPVRLRFADEQTNNEAEYNTLLAALRDLRQRSALFSDQLAIKILGDSLLVINQVKGEWKVKEPRLRVLRDHVLAELRHFKAYRLAYQPREDTLKVLGH